MKKQQGFYAFGLNKAVLKGVLRKGYKVPTPIQKKAIPVILEGKDVIAMSRTGSGKTIGFVLPCYEKLYRLEGKAGIKAIVLAPTRELSQQIYRVIKEIGKFTDYKCEIIHGGDSMEKQFAKILEFPDIIVATPGRLLHVLVEMDLKLSSVEYVVFDEADRLFEMGFHEQLNEILHRLPQSKQTVLFSATLPQQLVDFAKAGLNEPELIRLDVESKLSENLKTVYIGCRFNDKLAVLLHLVKSVIDKEESTVIFTPTRHHVDYIRAVLTANLIDSTFVFSSLEQKLRNENVHKFRTKQVNIMIVTDLAARGIDIPILDNVINFNFPAKPKLFVHRVGRVARAGNYGTAYSIVSFDELPYVHELSLFLNHEFKIPNEDTPPGEDGVYGSCPQSVLDEENESIKKILDTNKDLKDMLKVSENAYKLYIKTREKASGESVRKMKKYNTESILIHPIFKSKLNSTQEEELKKNSLLASLKNFKTNSTIFEIDRKKQKSTTVINETRKYFEEVISKKTKSKEVEDIQEEYENTIETSKDFKDDEFYLPYLSKDHHSEKGLKINENRAALQNAAFSIHGDEEEDIRKAKLNEKHWDRKKKKFIGEIEDIRAKKFKTESGNWISASYKTDLFKKWQEKNKVDFSNAVSFEENDETKNLKKRNQEVVKMVSNKFKNQVKGKKTELKDKCEIIKKRMLKERFEKYQKSKEKKGFKNQKGSKGFKNQKGSRGSKNQKSFKKEGFKKKSFGNSKSRRPMKGRRK